MFWATVTLSCTITFRLVNPFPDDKFRLFQTERVCKFDENVGKFSKREENTGGKGEIAHYEQFLLFPQCFLKTCTVDM